MNMDLHKELDLRIIYRKQLAHKAHLTANLADSITFLVAPPLHALAMSVLNTEKTPSKHFYIRENRIFCSTISLHCNIHIIKDHKNYIMLACNDFIYVLFIGIAQGSHFHIAKETKNYTQSELSTYQKLCYEEIPLQ